MKILLWDIETAPTQAFVWKLWKENVGLNQVVEPGYILCWAAKWLGEDEVYYDSCWRNDEESMVANLWDLLNEADAIVTYNGNHFDTPTLQAAFLKYNFIPPAPSKSIDLYQVVRSQFRLLSNRLDYVLKFLGLDTKLETGGFSLWARVMDGDPEAQKQMLDYNAQDVVVLEDLYHRLRPWIKNHPQIGHGFACPSCGSKSVQARGYHTTKVYLYRRYQCNDCGTWSRERLRAEKEAINDLVGV